jgi:hypothetical protein
MITVNKPANFYWEYTCRFQQGVGYVSILSFNNNTLATVTANSTITGRATFTFSQNILTYLKTYIFGNCLPNPLVGGSPTTFSFIQNSDYQITVSQVLSDGNNRNGFDGYLTIRIYP